MATTSRTLTIPLLWPQVKFWGALCDPKIRRVAYGGSRGGGKSDISRRAMIWRRILYPGTNGILFRRTIKAVVDNHWEPLRKLLKEMAIPYEPNVRDRKLKLLSPYAGEIHLGFAEKSAHIDLYQGTPYLDMAFDEATQFPEAIFSAITGSNRCEVENAQIKVWFTCNPGGRGHGWVRRKFVNAETRAEGDAFIPSRLEDNVILTARDPGYAARLTADLPAWKVRQWLDGDWDAVEGAYFSVPPEAICEVDMRSRYWAKWVAGVDYGYWPSAFAVVWIAYWQEPDGRRRAHIYRELKRHRLEMDEQAEQAVALERTLPPHERIIRFADPATGKRLEGLADEQGRTVARVWAMNGFPTVAAQRHYRPAGWRQVQMLLSRGVLTIDPSCMAFRTELGDAVYEGDDGAVTGDDIDEGCEDHLLDAARYALSSIYPLQYEPRDLDPYEPRPLDWLEHLDRLESVQQRRMAGRN